MMTTGWRYRVLSVGGVVTLTTFSLLVANHPLTQRLFTSYVPLFHRLEPNVLSGARFFSTLALCLAVVGGALFPMYKPRPRRILDTIFLTEKRVLVSGFALATFGFFEWSQRLPRATLVLLASVLGLVLPAWFVIIRRPRRGSLDRTVIVGDDLAQMNTVRESIDAPILGYLCSPNALPIAEPVNIAPDGGVAGLEDLDHLGGLSRLEDVLVKHDIDTVVLAFGTADRGEFFGALDACYEYGVDAKVHRDYTDSVLTPESSVGPLVDVVVEPWDWLDYALKRLFDIGFALVGFLLWSPFTLVIVLAIKLDSSGPVLYKQERTAVLGETFSVYKFRTMHQDAEAGTGAKISEEDAGGVDPRVTRVGRFLRTTHIDEIPQLWSVLKGDMSVVGPRPERPELDSNIENGVVDWRKRWFVRPGLTGLAQVNNVTGHDAQEKLRLDLEYIRKQSITYDLKIVVRQLWMVLEDSAEVLRSR